MPCQTAHITLNRHFIVIEDDHHGLLTDGCVIQALIGHAAGGGAVTDQCNHIVVLPHQGSCPGHTQGNGDGTGCMTGHKSVTLALSGLWEPGHTAKLPQMLKIRLASCQQLMHIRLVSDIKNQAVFHCIKYGLDGNGKLHRTQVGCQMASGFGHTFYQEVPDLPAQLSSLLIIQTNKIIVTADSL